MKYVHTYKKVRTDLQLTQDEFASVMGVGRAHWAKIESGIRHLPHDSIAKMAQLTLFVEGQKKAANGRRKVQKTYHSKIAESAVNNDLAVLPLKIEVETHKLKLLLEKHKRAKEILENMGDDGYNKVRDLSHQQSGILKTSFSRLKSWAEGEEFKNIIQLRVKIATMKAALKELKNIKAEWLVE